MGFSDLRLSNFFLIFCAGVVIHQSHSDASTLGDYPKLAGAVKLNELSIVIDNATSKFVVDCKIPYDEIPPIENSKASSDAEPNFEALFKVGEKIVSIRNGTLQYGVTNLHLEENLPKSAQEKPLTCEVRVKWRLDSWSDYIVSNEQWISFNPPVSAGSSGNYHLVLKEDETIRFRLGSSMRCSNQNEFCTYSVEILGSNKEAVKLSQCKVVLRQNQTLSNEIRIFAPRKNSRPKPFNVTIEVRSAGDGSGRKTAHMHVRVERGNTRQECKSIGDPHLVPFPDQKGIVTTYDFFAPGDYYLLRTKSHIGPRVEIQVSQFQCNQQSNGQPISCNSGVFAREGNTIVGLTIGVNDSKPSVTKYVLDENPSTAVIQFGSTILDNDKLQEWTISLLSSGIVIGVNILATWNPRAIDVYVYSTKEQLNRYIGLCSPSAKDNTSIARVSPKNSFFNLTDQSQSCWEPTIPIPSCSCQSTNAACEAQRDRTTEEIKFNYNRKITCKKASSANSDKRDFIQLRQQGEEHKQQEKWKRTRGLKAERRNDETFRELMDRAEDVASLGKGAEEEEKEEEERELVDLKKWQEEIEKDEEQRVVSRTITKETATKRCIEALRLTATYNLCSDRVDTKYLIYTCVTDATLMNDDGPVKTVPTEFERACLDSIILSLESVDIAADNEKFKELNDLKTEVEKLICPSQCNQRGICVDSSCICESDYIGSDCSLKKDQVPTIQKIVRPVCDIQNPASDCQAIDVDVNDVVDQGSVTCQMRSIKGSVGGVPAVQTSTTSASGGLVVCRLPSLPVSRESTDASRVAVYTVQVSISNDGQNFSTELPFTVFDGRCVECTTQPEINCKRKANGCDE